MPTLLDQIRQRMEKEKAPDRTPDADSIQKLIRTKSGKMQGGGGPTGISAGEEVARSTAKAQVGQAQQGSNIASEALGQKQADVKSQGDIKQAGLLQQEKSLHSGLQIKENQILNNLRREGDKLSSDEKVHQLEMLGASLALQDKEYVHNLQMTGERLRTKEGISMDEMLFKSAIGNDFELNKNTIEFSRLMNAQDREFTDALARFDVNVAIQTANSRAKSKNSELFYTGLQDVVVGSAEAADAYSKQAKEEDEE